MEEVAPGVHRFGSPIVSWYVVLDGGAVTLVDAGFPRHWRQLEPGLRALGRRLSDVAGVVLTHSHVDHTGFAERLRRERGTPVFVHRADAVGGARRFPPLRRYVRPSSWPLLWEGLRDGMVLTPRIGATRALPDGELPLPGRPRAVHLGGHTPGSAAVALDDRGVVFTGDNLVTFDPYTRRRGPQLMSCGVQHDERAAAAALGRLAEVGASVVLPGHGEPWLGGVAEACARAAARHDERRAAAAPGLGRSGGRRPG